MQRMRDAFPRQEEYHQPCQDRYTPTVGRRDELLLHGQRCCQGSDSPHTTDRWHKHLRSLKQSESQARLSRHYTLHASEQACDVDQMRLINSVTDTSP